MKKNKNIKVIDIMQMIAKGEDNFKFRVNDGCNWGALFEVEDGIVTSHGKNVEWFISDGWLNCEAKIVDNESEESDEELVNLLFDSIVKTIKKISIEISEEDED